MKQTKAIHEQWEKSKRKWEATISLSETHKNTMGCEFELNLKAMITEATKLDSVLLATERATLTMTPLTDTQIKDAAKASKELKELMDAGNKKKALILKWCHAT